MWSGKCPVGELSVRGYVHRGSFRRGTVESGNCPHTVSTLNSNIKKAEAKFSKRDCLKALKTLVRVFIKHFSLS